MAKFYVKSGDLRRVCLGKDHLDAAVKSVYLWSKHKFKTASSIHVSETGFGTVKDHPHHEKDVVIPTAFAKSKIRKKT